MFGRCKRSLSAAARDNGDSLDLDLRRLCVSEATCARKRLASDDPSGCDAATAVDVLSGNAPKLAIRAYSCRGRASRSFFKEEPGASSGRPLTAHERCWHGFCEEWAGPGSRAACASADPGRDRRITSGPHSRTSPFAVTNLRADAYNRCILQFKQIPWPQQNAAANRADTTGGQAVGIPR